MEMTHYVLTEDHRIREEPDIKVWGEWFSTADRHVGDTYTETCRVSTVFLGINHRFFGEGPPLLFETMVFEKEGTESPLVAGMIVHEDLFTARYSSWDDAEAGHKATVKRILKMEKDALKAGTKDGDKKRLRHVSEDK